MLGKKGHKILTFKRAAAFLMSMCLLLGSSDFGLTLEAAENVSATFTEKLSEDGTSSEITMSVSAADQNTEILQIENPDGTVSGDASVTTYSVAENGTYEFSVTYQVNGEDESKETFSYIVSGIGKAEGGTAVTDENSEAGNATEEENIPDVAGEAGDGKDTNETAETETGNTGGVTAAVNGPAKAPRAVGDVEVNQENFPDSMFRGRVLEYDLDHDGFLSEEEILNVTVIAVPADGIRTLAGIEYFTALVELDCSGQGSSLTGTLDLSANTALRILDCEDNSLSQLNLSANTELITLKCGENNIRSLDLSKNNKLQTIDCSYNSLQSLDLSNNTALETLICNENRSMTSLTIENCPELRYLKCDYTYLKKIDITKNSNLTDLICSQCSLSELDVSNNTNLVNLDCSYNRDLSSLDLTNNEKLASLNCEYTGLTELDVRQNPVLKSLDIGRNRQMEMPDLSNNMDLEVLNCDWMELDNLDVTPYKSLLELNCGYNNLTELDVSQNIDLVVLHCDGNELGELDISHNSFIEELWCGSNNLENLDVTHQPQLKIFSCSGNNIKSLNLSNNTMLERFQADRNKFTYIVCGENSLEHLGTSGTDFMASNQSPELSLTYDSNLGSWRTAEGTFGADTVFAGTNVSIDPDKHYAVVPDNITEADFTWSWPGTTYKVKGKVTFVYPPEPTGIEINELNFPDDNFRAYVSENFDKDTNGYLSDEEIANVTEVNVISREINDLKGIEYFTAITKLYCGSNNLTTLDVSRNTLLEKLTCSSNHLTALDVSNNMALTTLECHSNALTALDVSKNTSLKTLYCYSNQLEELNLGQNSALTTLECQTNNLTSLDVSGVPSLTTLQCQSNALTTLNTGSAASLKMLWCQFNKLTSLDVSEAISLETLNCNSNELTSLITGDVTALTSINCSSNKLTELNVSGNTGLTSLNCGSNQLTELDISHNTLLEILRCGSNRLEQLEVSGNTALTSLVCSSNALTELDVTKNAALTNLNCDSNALTELDVTENTALTDLSCNANQLSQLDLSKNGSLRYLYCDDNHLAYLIRGNNIALLTSQIRGARQTLELSVTSGDTAGTWQTEADTFNANTTFDETGVSFDSAENCAIIEGEVTESSFTWTMPSSVRSLSGTITFVYPEATGIPIDEEHFPDPIFRQYISDNFDENSNDYLSDEEIDKVKNISVGKSGISSLEGIEYFPELTLLICEKNSLTELDLSANTKLTYVMCGDNQLTTLDVSNNTALEYLSCGGNQLTELDVNKNMALVHLACDQNKLTELNVADNTALESLMCIDNLLTEIDVSNNTALKELYCNGNQLTELDVTNNTALTAVTCMNNKLSHIIYGDNTLEHLGEGIGIGFFGSDQSFELALTYDVVEGVWRTADNTFQTGTTCPDYEDYAAFVAEGNYLTIDDALISLGATQINFSWTMPENEKAVVSGTVTLDISEGILINKENFPDDNFRAFLQKQSYGADGVLSTEEIAAVTSIDVSIDRLNEALGTTGETVADLTGIGFFSALTELKCGGNTLTALNVSENAQLAVLDCENNDLTVLDVSQNTNLVSLNCYKNDLTELKLGSKKFDEINCAENELTYITGSAVNFEDMESYSGANQLVELPVMYDEDAKVWRTADNTFMQNIEFTGADVSFVAEGNYITVPDSVESAEFEWNMPDVSQSGGTTGGWLRGTVRFVQIEGIPINEANFPDSNFRNFLLEQDYGTDGFLTSEEIKGITSMDCSEKGIADLTGIDYFTSLTELDCANNQLTSLEIETRYTSVNCSYNEISDLYLADNYDGSNLETLDCSWNQLLRIRSDEEFEQHNLKIGSVSGRNQHVSVTLTYDETNSSWKSQDQILGPNTNFTVYDAPDSMTADTELGCIRSTAGTDITSALYSAYVCGMDAQSNNIGGEITITYNYVRNGYIAVEEAQALESADDLKQFRLFGGLSSAEEASLSIEVADFTGMQAGTRKAYNVTYSWTDDSGVPVQETREITVVPEGSSFTPSRNSYISLATDLEYNIGETMTVGNFDWLRLNGLAALNAGKGQFTSGTYEPAYEKIVALTSGIMGRAEWVVEGVLHYTEYGNYPVTYTIQVGAEQLKITQMVHVMPDEPTGLVIIPSSIELEQVKGSPTIEASTTSEVSLETDAQGDYMPDVNITADAEFQITNRDQESLECVVYVNESKYDGSGPLAVLNKNRDVVSQQFEIRALKGDEGYTGEFNGTMNFTVSYEE